MSKISKESSVAATAAQICGVDHPTYLSCGSSDRAFFRYFWILSRSQDLSEMATRIKALEQQCAKVLADNAQLSIENKRLVTEKEQLIVDKAKLTNENELYTSTAVAEIFGHL